MHVTKLRAVVDCDSKLLLIQLGNIENFSDWSFLGGTFPEGEEKTKERFLRDKSLDKIGVDLIVGRHISRLEKPEDRNGILVFDVYAATISDPSRIDLKGNTYALTFVDYRDLFKENLTRGTRYIANQLRRRGMLNPRYIQKATSNSENPSILNR